jgi:hypothetical protein
MRSWDGASEIDVAVFVDIDGTLCSYPKAGQRELRPFAVDALKELSSVAHVVLWSMGGSGAGERLLKRFPELAPYVSRVTGKGDFPDHLIRDAYSIDDGDVTECAVNGNRVTVSSFKGGADSGTLLEAARRIVDDIRRNGG